MAWVAIIGAAVSAYSQNRAQKSSQRAATQGDLKSLGAAGNEDRRTLAYEAAINDYYGQLGNERARKSLGNFAAWSNPNLRGGDYHQEPPPTEPTLPPMYRYDKMPNLAQPAGVFARTNQARSY